MVVWGLEKCGSVKVWGLEKCGSVKVWGVSIIGDTRGSFIVISADDVLEMNVMRAVRGVCGVYEMCMRMTRENGGDWVRGFGLTLMNHVGP